MLVDGPYDGTRMVIPEPIHVLRMAVFNMAPFARRAWMGVDGGASLGYDELQYHRSGQTRFGTYIYELEPA